MLPSDSFHFIWSLSSERTVSFSRPDPGHRRQVPSIMDLIPPFVHGTHTSHLLYGHGNSPTAEQAFSTPWKSSAPSDSTQQLLQPPCTSASKPTTSHCRPAASTLGKEKFLRCSSETSTSTAAKRGNSHRDEDFVCILPVLEGYSRSFDAEGFGLAKFSANI